MRALFEIETREEKNVAHVWETFRIVGASAPNAVMNLHRKFVIDKGVIVTGVKMLAEIDG